MVSKNIIRCSELVKRYRLYIKDLEVENEIKLGQAVRGKIYTTLIYIFPSFRANILVVHAENDSFYQIILDIYFFYLSDNLMYVYLSDTYNIIRDLYARYVI